MLEEALEALRGCPVWLEVYAAGAVCRMLSQLFVPREFRVDRLIPAGRGVGGKARNFWALPDHVAINSYVPEVGYSDSVSF